MFFILSFLPFTLLHGLYLEERAVDKQTTSGYDGSGVKSVFFDTIACSVCFSLTSHKYLCPRKRDYLCVYLCVVTLLSVLALTAEMGCG